MTLSKIKNSTSIYQNHQSGYFHTQYLMRMLHNNLSYHFVDHLNWESNFNLEIKNIRFNDHDHNGINPTTMDQYSHVDDWIHRCNIDGANTSMICVDTNILSLISCIWKLYPILLHDLYSLANWTKRISESSRWVLANMCHKSICLFA